MTSIQYGYLCGSAPQHHCGGTATSGLSICPVPPLRSEPQHHRSGPLPKNVMRWMLLPLRLEPQHHRGFQRVSSGRELLRYLCGFEPQHHHGYPAYVMDVTPELLPLQYGTAAPSGIEIVSLIDEHLARTLRSLPIAAPF
ncbi:hypothetical protein FH965_29315 [Streptomyces spectabilis]|uniref:Uncharacterized protein n=2 Tax=Streptomyces spectabilis TaxID=68270 RepID=A0A516REU5_STRST|nr:hypothetical protein FH965_29315 [Streptomyces spectabilis]